MAVASVWRPLVWRRRGDSGAPVEGYSDMIDDLDRLRELVAPEKRGPRETVTLGCEFAHGLLARLEAAEARAASTLALWASRDNAGHGNGVDLWSSEPRKERVWWERTVHSDGSDNVVGWLHDVPGIRPGTCRRVRVTVELLDDEKKRRRRRSGGGG